MSMSLFGSERDILPIKRNSKSFVTVTTVLVCIANVVAFILFITSRSSFFERMLGRLDKVLSEPKKRGMRAQIYPHTQTYLSLEDPEIASGWGHLHFYTLLACKTRACSLIHRTLRSSWQRSDNITTAHAMFGILFHHHSGCTVQITTKDLWATMFPFYHDISRMSNFFKLRFDASNISISYSQLLILSEHTPVRCFLFTVLMIRWLFMTWDGLLVLCIVCTILYSSKDMF